MVTKPNEAAFARPYSHDMQTGYCRTNGLTKREYFAAMAMQGFCSRLGVNIGCGETAFAMVCAVNVADALIAALNKEPE